jgi:hypothetical protein
MNDNFLKEADSIKFGRVSKVKDKIALRERQEMDMPEWGCLGISS